MAWYHRIRNVFRADRVKRDIDRELAFHIQERTDDLKAAGLSPADAASAARKQFGNSTLQAERTRDLNITGWLEAIARDTRLAIRSLARTPAFTATVILTLALGIGANSAVFSALDAVLLKPLPFPEPDRLIAIRQAVPGNGEVRIAPVRIEDWNRLNSTFEAISGVYTADESELSGELPEKVGRALLAPRFLQVMGVSPALGRDFTAQEQIFGGPNAILISDRFWRRRFNADPAAIGKQLRMAQYSYTIIGVMPASFVYPDRNVDLWSPNPSNLPVFMQRRDLTWYLGIGRLKRGVALAQARDNLAAVQKQLGEQYGGFDSNVTVVPELLKDTTVGTARSSVWVLFGSVWLLLLIACTNIAALLLARAADRRRELSVRFSLGASRARVAAQLLTETGVLAFSGASAGLLVAAAASRVFRTLAKDLPRVDEIRLDSTVALYTLACALVVTFLCGVLPAIRSMRGESLARGGRTEVSGRQRLQWLLAGTQVALAVTLLAGAGLLMRSLYELGRVRPGFEPSNMLTFHVTSSWQETGDMNALRNRTDRMLEGFLSVPGVVSAATSIGSVPGVPGNYEMEYKLAPGRAESDPKLLAESRDVSPAYFDTMQIPLIEGEPCTREPGVASVVVNKRFSDQYLNGGAVGHFLQHPNPRVQPVRIRGVVGDAREAGINRASPPTVYWCGGAAQPYVYFLIRTKNDPSTMAATLRRKFAEIEPRRSMFDVMPLEERLDDAFAENRLRTVLLGFFAATAVALACVGLYGTLSYLVNTRRREVGLRLALGAARSQIISRFLSQGLGVASVACLVGLGLALAFTRVLAEMLYGVSPSDPLTLTAVIAAVLLVASLASLLPAQRASRVEPMQVLRDE
jgi:putative ABC transport system permease protein